MLSSIGTRLLDLIAQIGYEWIAFAMFLENLFPPIPSELIMPFGWFLAGQGTMSLWLVILAGVLGTYIGVLPFYLLGWFLHKERLLQRTARRGAYIGIQVEDIQKAFDAFHKRGYPFVLFWRFIPLFRTIISFPAGAVRMNFRRYSVYTLLWSLIWCSLLAYIGYILGDQWSRVWAVMKEYEHLILWAIVLAVLVFGWKRLYPSLKKRR